MPPALCQASELRILTISHQQMYGGIPSFTATLLVLAVHHNHLSVLPDIHLADYASIMLHNNFFSCYVPACGNATARTSVVAIGNLWRLPNGDFPAWVLQHERDPLLWISGTEGMSLVQKISGAVGFFMLVVGSKLGRARLMGAIFRWQIGPANHLWVVMASSYLHTHMAMGCPVAAVFIMFLLSSDPYVCPQIFATMSACSRRSALIHTLVFLRWCTCCYSLPVEHFLMDGEKQEGKRWTAKILAKRLLLSLLWCVLTVILSTVAILYQVAKSIPGVLEAGKVLSLGLKAFIGATQGFVANFLVPFLASKITWEKHVFATMSILLMNYIIPAVVIIYLDTECLGRWASLWKPCRSKSELFQRRVACTPENNQDCFGRLSNLALDIMVLRSSDICDPHFSGSAAAMSRCIQISLLRLQEVWLTKFITSGLVMPGVALMRGKLPTESGAVVGNLGMYMAYALMSSGHLPLMNIILFLAFLGEGLVARVAWAEQHLRVKNVQVVAAPVVRTARLLSLIVHLASAAGDPPTLVLVSTYISMLIITKYISVRRAAERESRVLG